MVNKLLQEKKTKSGSTSTSTKTDSTTSSSSSSSCSRCSSNNSSDCGCSSSSSSSSSSCCELHCSVRPQKCVPAEQVYCKTKSAVVGVRAEFLLMGDGVTPALSSALAERKVAMKARNAILVANARMKKEHAKACLQAKREHQPQPTEPKYTDVPKMPQEGTPIDFINSTSPIAAHNRYDVIMKGNGVFLRGHYILCPAHLILLPPSLTSVVNRYPLKGDTANPVGLNDDSRMINEMVRASRILVEVYNVNNDCKSYIYEASLVGVDGAGDVAILKINHGDCDAWNQCLPKIKKCHPFLRWGCSRALRPGNKVYLIGDGITHQDDLYMENAKLAITEGIVSDERYFDYSGNYAPELVLVSNPAFAYSSGLPILDCKGRLVAMQTTDVVGTYRGNNGVPVGTGFVAGPSQYFMCKPIRNLIVGQHGKCVNRHVETVSDNVGSYLRYVKGYLGLGYRVFNGVDYDVTHDFQSGGAVLSHSARVRLDVDGKFLSSPSGRDLKELAGIMVLGLAGLNPLDDDGAVTDGYYYVPGSTEDDAVPAPLFDVMPVSGLIGAVRPGYLITKLDGRTPGDLGKQEAPALQTWASYPGDLMNVCFRQGGNANNTADNSTTDNYEVFGNAKVALGTFPQGLDYPWLTNKFPSLVGIFNFPLTQFSDQQVPLLESSPQGTVFQASI